MQTVWVIAETRDGALKKVSLELISAARSLGSGSPEPEDRDASTAAPEAPSEATTADDEADDVEASASAPTDTPPVEIAPPPVPRSGGFLPSFGELAFCFGSTFLATLAVVLWLWRRRDEWTG